MWCVGELEIQFERIDAGRTYGVVDTREYLAMNPNGTVPTIVDDNTVLWETGAMLRYLAHKHAPDSFWPVDALNRAEIDKWAEWSKINIAFKFTAPVFWRVVRTPPAKRDPAAIRAALETLNGFLLIANKRLADHAFLAGNDLTLADIQFGHCLFRYFDIDIPRGDFPAISRYYKSLAQRPAFQRHVMVSYEELREYD